MASVRAAYDSTVQRHYSIAAILIVAAIALIVGVVIGVVFGGASLGLTGATAFSSITGGSITGGSVTGGELRQGGR